MAEVPRKASCSFPLAGTCSALPETLLAAELQAPPRAQSQLSSSCRTPRTPLGAGVPYHNPYLNPLMGHCRQTEHLVWCFTCSAMVTRCNTASHTMDCGSRLAHSRNWDASMADFPLLWGGERKGLLRTGTQPWWGAGPLPPREPVPSTAAAGRARAVAPHSQSGSSCGCWAPRCCPQTLPPPPAGAGPGWPRGAGRRGAAGHTVPRRSPLG